MKGANIAKLSVNGEFEVALLQVCLPPFPVVTSLPTLLIALSKRIMRRIFGKDDRDVAMEEPPQTTAASALGFVWFRLWVRCEAC